MASGHVNRTKRPNTWLHRPTCVREESPCQPGAVHTWHFSDIASYGGMSAADDRSGQASHDFAGGNEKETASASRNVWLRAGHRRGRATSSGCAAQAGDAAGAV